MATACAYAHTRESWCADWHIRIRDYAFSHYPVPTGEWTQWLDRYGNMSETAALPVKDPFHLPRGLIYLMEILKRGRFDDRERLCRPYWLGHARHHAAVVDGVQYTVNADVDAVELHYEGIRGISNRWRLSIWADREARLEMKWRLTTT